MQSFDIKGKIKEYVANRFQQTILDEADFHYEKARQAFNAFKEFGKTEPFPFLEDALNKFKNFNGSFSEFLPTLDKTSKEYFLFELGGKVVAYFDEKGYNKNIWNEYKDKRVIARANVRQDDWIRALLNYKIEGDNFSKLPGSIKNSIIFIENPQNGLTILSEKHRRMISDKFFNKEFDPEGFIRDFLDFFKDLEIPVINPENRNTYLCHCIYKEDIYADWHEDSEISKPIANNLVGLYLAKFGDDYNSIRFPGKTETEIFKYFKEKLHTKWTTIKNYRDIFDAYFPNRRTGHKEKDGSLRELGGSSKKVFDEYKDYSEENLWAVIESLIQRKNIESGTSINYWIFQCNPKIYDIREALKKGMVKNWNVTSHKDKIKPGDMGIIWATGPESGCYAFFKVISKPYIHTNSEAELKYYISQEIKPSLSCKIEILKNLYDSPILKDGIEKNPNLKNLKAGSQGTNFSLDYKEYSELWNIAMKKQEIKYWAIALGEQSKYWDYYKNKNSIGIGWGDLGNLKKFEDEDTLKKMLKKTFDSSDDPYNITRALWDFCNEIKIGDIVFVKEGTSKILAMGVINGDYEFKEKEEPYNHIRKVEWKVIKDVDCSEFPLPRKTLTQIYNDYRILALLKREFGLKDEDNKSGNRKISSNLNQIFYGPPGTGKTFKAIEILKNDFTTKSSNSDTKQILKKIPSTMAWWEVIAHSLKDLGGEASVSDLLNHDFIKIKFDNSSNNHVRQTLWGNLQAHSVESSETVGVSKRRPPYIFDKKKDSTWFLSGNWKEVLEDSTEDILDSEKSKGKDFKRYVMVTFHQNFSYEDFIEGIKPQLEESSGEDSDLTYQINPGIFRLICAEAKADPDNNYAIVIDEINRGNISAIFGELITLIEVDKREVLSIDLPYSKKQFSVPKNLFIVGTMNTADRSVEALDTALRRRFTFREFKPEPEIFRNELYKKEEIDLEKLLRAINSRLEKILDKDHCIGHSYFMKMNGEVVEDLKFIFKNNIIPLLQEYFYGNWAKIGMVLGESFVKKKSSEDVTFFSFGEDVEEFQSRIIYEITDAENWTLEDFKSIYEKK